jgi:lipid A 3-O-deacylase
MFGAMEADAGKTAMRLAATATLLLLLVPAGAGAEQRQRLTLLEENDSLPFGSDKHYSQGLRLSYLAAAERAPDTLFEAAAAVLPWLGGDAPRARRIALLLGQSIFTPKDTDALPPDRRDRPYAGWLYAGVSLLQESGGKTLDHIELQLGLIGPGALGKATQNEWHQFIGITEADGWSSQLQNEPGLVLEVERKWRLGLLGDRRLGVDLVPELGGVLGNVFTYGKTGGLVRVGTNLGADYGPARITPALSGTDWIDTEALADGLGFYLFAGVEGRAVGHNLFLDGNTFRSSRSVDKKPFVADFQAGFSVFWKDVLRVDVSAMRRTAEFEGQSAPDILGTVGLSVMW